MKTPQGEHVGVMFDGAVSAFRPVKVYSEDWAENEYGAMPDVLEEFVQKANKELDGDWKARRLRPFTGKLIREL